MIESLRSAVILALLVHEAIAFSTWNPLATKPKSMSHSFHVMFGEGDNTQRSRRRDFLFESLSLATFVAGASQPASAVERAVGSSEKACRADGNCLQNFDLDGAVGWQWGGKERCDATDPRCGLDGSLRDAPPSGQPIPELISDEGNPLKVTDVVQIEISIGKTEKGTLTIGLYGETCPNSVKQMMEFFSSNIYSGGLLTTSKLMLEDGLGVQTTPISFIKGGNLQTIYPQNRLDFGIASQAIAYAKIKGLSKAPDTFIPQPRPNKQGIFEEKSSRSHKVSGLLSIPQSGLGYGGSGLESEDEAFASAFEITANNVPAMDRENRKVVGQLMDEQSMEFLARLASLPTQKGLKGIIPGQNSGRPLVKVSVTSVTVTDSKDRSL